MYSFVAVEATLSLPILLSVYIMICRLHKILEIGLFVSSIVLLPAVFLLFPHAIKCLHWLQSQLECSLTDIEQDCTAHSFETVHVIYFYCSATNFLSGSVVFCQGGTVLCLLLNVSLIMTLVFYYKPFP